MIHGSKTKPFHPERKSPRLDLKRKREEESIETYLNRCLESDDERKYIFTADNRHIIATLCVRDLRKVGVTEPFDEILSEFKNAPADKFEVLQENEKNAYEIDEEDPCDYKFNSEFILPYLAEGKLLIGRSPGDFLLGEEKKYPFPYYMFEVVSKKPTA